MAIAIIRKMEVLNMMYLYENEENIVTVELNESDFYNDGYDE